MTITKAATLIWLLLTLALTVPLSLNIASSWVYDSLRNDDSGGPTAPRKELAAFLARYPDSGLETQTSNCAAGRDNRKACSENEKSFNSTFPQSVGLVPETPLNHSETGQGRFNFSACLLVKDDNKVLPEWLAYHYEVLPLRHLILGLDPYIITSPEPIVQKFRELGMSIEVWKAQEYLENGKHTAVADAPDEAKFKGHYQRQEVFMTKCLRRLRALNRSWTVLVDSDEYVTFHNYEGAASEGQHRDCRPLEPAERDRCVARINGDIQGGKHPRGRLPRIGEMTLADYIRSERNNNNSSDSVLNHYSCIVLPRIWMSAKESSDRRIRAQVPDGGFDPKAFVTLRYRHHSFFQNKYPGKSIVDVSRVSGEIVVGNPHRVLGDACKYGPFVNTGNSLFRIHHYVGSPEVFLFRPGDTHRTLEEFEKRNSYRTVGTTDATRGWLASFVRRVGVERALEVTVKLRQWGVETDAQVVAASKRLGEANASNIS